MDAEKKPIYHPDENLLVAFTEQAVTLQEREKILKHLSGCSRCREIVFLMQEATPAAPLPAQKQEPVSASRFWRRAPLWAFGSLAALVLVGSFTLVRMRLQQPVERPPQVASVGPVQKFSPAAPKEEIAREPVPAPPELEKPHLAAKVPTDKASPQTEHLEAGLIGALPPVPSAKENSPAQTVSISGAAEEQAPAFQGIVPSAVAPAGSNTANRSFRVSGAMHGTAPAVPAPLAGGFTSASEMSPAVNVMAQPSDSLMNEKLALTRPSSVALFKAVFRIQNGKLMRCIGDNCTERPLPDMQEATSVVSRKNVALVLDKSGKLFMSNNSGETWQAIPTQWVGQARNLQMVGERLVTRGHPGGGVIFNSTSATHEENPFPNIRTPKVAISIFALTNDKGETWQSGDDGKTWQRSGNK